MARYHGTASNDVVTLSIPARPSGYAVEITDIIFSYDDDPTGGLLTVESPASTVIMRHAITSGGPGPLAFTRPLPGGDDAAVVVTLAAGGAGVNGYLTVLTRD